MRPVIKTIFSIAAVLLGLWQSAMAYSLGGPIGNAGDAWQQQVIYYNLPGDLEAPKNIGQEYRRNTPVMFYTFDQNFADYFGSSGMAAVESAFNLLNVMFTNSPSGPARGLDGYSKDLSEFSLETRHINYQAQALGLLDMKSWTLSLMVEQLGLTDPVRFDWTLHDRDIPAGGKCPDNVEYLVVQRNFDYVSSPLTQPQYSPYVNDVLYSYQILEVCAPGPWLADAVEYSADPLADTYSPVASSINALTLDWGYYYTGLTRDDVAGLRYLMSTNNVNYEDASADSLLYTITTNTLAPTVFPPYLNNATNFVSGTNSGYYTFNGTAGVGYGYGDLAAFLSFAQTNDPATLLAAYPGLVISSYAVSEKIVSNATLVVYYTNAPVGSPYGSPPILVVKTNYTPVFEFVYTYKFANIFTNHYTTTAGQQVTLTVATPIGAPYGSAGVTNLTVKKTLGVGGDFFVLPPFYTNVCPLDIVSSAGTIKGVLAYTNGFLIALTNSVVSNLVTEVYTVTYFTNYSYVINPVTCTTTAGAAGYYQGIEKIKFVEVPITNYDTVFARFVIPVTNNYTLNMQTAGQVVPQFFQRVVTVPDFLVSAADLATSPSDAVIGDAVVARSLTFDQAHILQNLAGPGTITTPSTFTWDDVGPVYFNDATTASLDGTPYFTQIPTSTNFFYSVYHVLGSYDGTTNAPVVYPNGTSIDNLEYQVLTQLSPTSVPDGAYSVTYPNTQFSATGGSIVPPFTWSASGLPSGLALSSSGVLNGTPMQEGTFDFTITLTDSNGKTIQWYYTITIP
jgi:hypothetical protein